MTSTIRKASLFFFTDFEQLRGWDVRQDRGIPRQSTHMGETAGACLPISDPSQNLRFSRHQRLGQIPFRKHGPCPLHLMCW